MNWTFIGAVSLFGVGMGILSVNGYTQKIEFYLWLGLGLVTALIAARHVSDKVILNLLMAGLLWGTCNVVIQSLFFDRYLFHNPSLRENFSKVTFMHPRYFILITGPVIGLFTGLGMAGLTFLLKKIGI